MCFQGLQVRKQSESNPLYDPTDDPKKFDFQPNFKPDTPLPGTLGTSSWSPETPLGHRTGPKPDFHRFLRLRRLPVDPDYLLRAGSLRCLILTGSLRAPQ